MFLTKIVRLIFIDENGMAYMVVRLFYKRSFKNAFLIHNLGSLCKGWGKVRTGRTPKLPMSKVILYSPSDSINTWFWAYKLDWILTMKPLMDTYLKDHQAKSRKSSNLGKKKSYSNVSCTWVTWHVTSWNLCLSQKAKIWPKSPKNIIWKHYPSTKIKANHLINWQLCQVHNVMELLLFTTI